MKTSTNIALMLWLAMTINCFAQGKISKEVFSEKFTNERLKEIHNPNVDVLQRINDIDSLLLKSKNKTWQTALRNSKREFYEEERFNVKNTRTTINKTLLGDGFLLIEEYDQFWDSSSSAWVNKYKDSYTYDGNNNQTEWLYQTWDGSAWRNNSKTSYTYDVNNNLIEALVQTGPAWENTWKYSYTYDANNKLIETLGQHWDGSHWVIKFKIFYIYGGSNYLIEALVQTWEGLTWVNYCKDSYTYDANNNLTELLEQYWSGSAWLNMWKYSYTYDGNNNLTEYFYQYWNDYDSTWQNLEKYLYTYDGNNTLTEELYQLGQGFVWENFLKTFYTYDINNNQIEALCYRCDGSGWVFYYKASYTYDGNNNLTELLWQVWDGFGWVDNRKLIYSYIPTDVKESTGEFNDYSLSNNYPNPFNPSTTIRYSIPTTSQVTIKVFDIIGNEIETLVDEEMSLGKYEVKFNGSGLSSGIYFYKIAVGNFVETKKMILLK